MGNVLAGYVVGLQVRFLRADNGEWTSSTDEVSIRTDGIFVNEQPIEGGFNRAEVTMTVLTPKGGELLANQAIDLPTAIERFGTTVVRQTASFLGGR